MSEYIDIFNKISDDSCGNTERQYWNGLYTDFCGMSVADARVKCCNKKGGGGDDPKKEEKILDILKKDYAELFAESDKLYYWESHIELNMNLEDAESVEQLKPVLLENIFEINEVVIQRTHDLVNGGMTEKRVHDTWWNSWAIHPEDFVITLEDALKAYWESDIIRTTGNKVSMRRPFTPSYKVPYYILGQLNSPKFVFVNAVTGEVSLGAD